MRRIMPRLTYGNVVATLALLIALGGTAYAAATIGSKQIINNSIKSVDVRNGTLALADMTASARSALRPRWALVDADGTIIAQSGGVSVSTPGGGDYYVNMGTNLTGRGIVATKAWTASDFTTSGTPMTALCGGAPPQGVSCSQSNNNQTVYVGMSNVAGTGENNPFYVAAL